MKSLPFYFLIFLSCVTAWAQEFSNPYDIEPERQTTYTFRIVLEPKERTVISAELNTPVVKIYKRMGDHFSPGDLLVSLDNRVAEGNFFKAIAKRDKTLLEWEGKKQLYEKDLTSLFEVVDAEAAYADALSDVIAAEKFLSATEIRASYKGKVVRLALEEQELAQVGREIIETLRDDYILGRFLAPASIYNCLTPGTEVTLTVSGQIKKAHITRLSPVIDPTSGTIKVESEIDNTETQWIPGTIGTISVQCPPAKGQEEVKSEQDNNQGLQDLLDLLEIQNIQKTIEEEH